MVLDLGKDLGDTLVDATLAGQITGTAEAAGSFSRAADSLFGGVFVPPSDPSLTARLLDDPPTVRFPTIEKAVKTLKDAPVFAGNDFRETAEAVRSGSFAITGDLTDETLRSVRQLLADDIASGADTATFIKDLDEAFTEGVGLSEGRMRMVFRTNVGQAVSNSNEQALESPFVQDSFPYRRYNATNDLRVRPEHLALETTHGLNGTQIYWKDDPVWDEFRPPFSWNCRCSWSPVTVLQAKERGVREAIEWWARAKVLADRFGGPVQAHLAETEPATHETVPHPPFSAPPEFRRNATTVA